MYPFISLTGEVVVELLRVVEGGAPGLRDVGHLLQVVHLAKMEPRKEIHF